ncbi:hypothetical protein NC797_05035 [Aquibacillus sp. 3ASR75-11]|uniref:Uncharacterized protein n=1 Tax=Terrihalobacillus insolitus TaxID=2950438 RepID=A0A9X3WV46_9BACI|nr:hypothetical protein [Terrihalobacillus insolitus]MDC3412454.1 hypothetical protein [Terrihalobacillus insolitus]MDC3423874.1 hypothetical protein [Terrihalobacillus insolitus]
MNVKKLVCLIGLATILFVSGCSTSRTISISDNSKIALIPDGEGGKALTFAVIMENNSNKESVPFYVEFEIEDEWLSSIVEKNKFIVGESMGVDKLGALYSIEANSEFQAGHTYRIAGEIEEIKLKETIEQNDSVKVNLLNEKEKVIYSDFIRNFGKDFSTDGVDETAK